MSPITGELVTERLAGYGGGRQVTVYVPPAPAEAVVFAGDGQLVAQWGESLEGAGVPPAMIVGVHRLPDETLRLQEYSLGFAPERFAAHEKFFVEDVRGWVRARFGAGLPAERTAVFGVSVGGELALALGLRHPDVYGAVFCASPGGGYTPPVVMPSLLPRAYLVVGCEVAGGDFFQGVPGGADGYILANVLHDWDDDRSVQILSACRRGMAEDGRVLIVERLIPDDPAAAVPVLLSDLNTLVISGGQERTNAEYGELLAAAGLNLNKVQPVALPTASSKGWRRERRSSVCLLCSRLPERAVAGGEAGAQGDAGAGAVGPLSGGARSAGSCSREVIASFW